MRDPQARRRPSLLSVIPLHLLLACYALYLFRFGYGFGSSDQDEFLPYLLHLLNPDLFAKDWFVQTQLSSFSVRTYFVYTLLPFAKLFNPFYATTLFYLASWLIIASGLYAIAYYLTKDKIAAIASVFFILVLTPLWTLGGNEFVHSMLVPSMAAWSLGLWGFVFFLRDQHIVAGILIGLATLFQALVGLQLCMLLGLLMLTYFISDPKRLSQSRKIVAFSSAFLLFALPALIPLFSQQLVGNAALADGDASHLFYIMAAFRNPHHYLFHSFSIERVVQFGVLLTAGTATILYSYSATCTFKRQVIIRLLAIITILCILAYVGTEIYPHLFIAKLQLFKLTLVAKSLLAIVICAQIASSIQSSAHAYLSRLLFSYPRSLTGIFLALLLTMALTNMDRISTKIYPLSHAGDPITQIATWTKRHTPRDAIFALPPSWSGFRTHSQRSIIVNHKAFPYKDADIFEWYDRLQTLAPVAQKPRTASSLLEELDKAFESHNIETLEQLNHQHPFDYLIRSTALPVSNKVFKPILIIEQWHVYRRI